MGTNKRCTKCGNALQVLFRKWTYRADGTILRPIPPKKCIIIRVCPNCSKR